jgi:hypothetical protein
MMEIGCRSDVERQNPKKKEKRANTSRETHNGLSKIYCRHVCIRTGQVLRPFFITVLSCCLAT